MTCNILRYQQIIGRRIAHQLAQLPPKVKQAVVPNGTVGLRVPAHPLILDVLRMLTGPVALTSANQTGQPEAITAEEVVSAFGDQIDLVLDGELPIAGDHMEILRDWLSE